MAAFQDNTFVVIWVGDYSGQRQTRGQKFHYNLTKQGNEFRVNDNVDTAGL